MTGSCAACLHRNHSRSYLNHPVLNRIVHLFGLFARSYRGAQSTEHQFYRQYMFYGKFNYFSEVSNDFILRVNQSKLPVFITMKPEGERIRLFRNASNFSSFPSGRPY